MLLVKLPMACHLDASSGWCVSKYGGNAKWTVCMEFYVANSWCFSDVYPLLNFTKTFVAKQTKKYMSLQIPVSLIIPTCMINTDRNRLTFLHTDGRSILKDGPFSDVYPMILSMPCGIEWVVELSGMRHNYAIGQIDLQRIHLFNFFFHFYNDIMKGLTGSYWKVESAWIYMLWYMFFYTLPTDRKDPRLLAWYRMGAVTTEVI